MRWRRSLADSQRERLGPPVLDGNTVFVAGARTGLHALDAWTGDRRWTVDEARSSSSPAVVDGLVLVNGSNGLIAVSADDGEIRWRTAAASPSESSAASGSTSSAASGSTSTASNPTRRSTSTPSPDAETRTPAPSVVDGVVYALRGGVAVALDARTGERRWGTILFNDADSLAVAAGRAFVGGSDLVTLDTTDGSTAWTATVGHTSEPVVSGERVYAGGYDGLHAFDASDGTAQWTYRREYGGFSTPAVTDDDVVYAVEEPPEGPRAVFSLDAATGEPTPRWCSWLGTGSVEAVTPETVLVETEVDGANDQAVQAFTRSSATRCGSSAPGDPSSGPPSATASSTSRLKPVRRSRSGGGPMTTYEPRARRTDGDVDVHADRDDDHPSPPASAAWTRRIGLVSAVCAVGYLVVGALSASLPTADSFVFSPPPFHPQFVKRAVVPVLLTVTTAGLPLGLLGLRRRDRRRYDTLTDRCSLVALVGTVLIVAGFGLLACQDYLTTFRARPDSLLLSLLFLAVFVVGVPLTALGFVAFGVRLVRTDVCPRVGYALVAGIALSVTVPLLWTVATLPDWSTSSLVDPFALAWLYVGYDLWRRPDSSSDGRPDPPSAGRVGGDEASERDHID